MTRSSNIFEFLVLFERFEEFRFHFSFHTNLNFGESLIMAITNGNSHSQLRDGNQIKHGERLLSQVIDTWAAEDPDYIVGMMAKSNSNSVPLDFINLSLSQLANAVNYTSHWLDKTLDTKAGDMPRQFHSSVCRISATGPCITHP